MHWLTVDLASRGLGFAVGVLLLISTTISVLRTIVIPRALRSTIADTVAFSIIGTARLLSRMAPTYKKRDSVMAWAGPLIILGQMIAWLLLYLFAYGLLIYGVGGTGYGESLREAGSSLFTLGFASVNTEEQTVLDFMAAATGPILIAMMIGFLPTVYGIYLEREVDVTRLSSVAGEPAWGPEYLARHFLAGRLAEMPGDFLDWSRWASQLRMTHVTYPVLLWVRSARASRHYAVTLLAVLDAASLQIALCKSMSRSEASRLILEAGQACEVLNLAVSTHPQLRHAVPFTGVFTDGTWEHRGEARRLPSWNDGITAVQMAADQDIMNGFDAEGVEALIRGDEEPLRITRAEFDHAYDYLQSTGFPIECDKDEGWEQFRIERARYEFPALELCRLSDATPAPWSGSRRIPTPIYWPTLAGDMLRELDGDEA